jgi:hypothetical protein
MSDLGVTQRESSTHVTPKVGGNLRPCRNPQPCYLLYDSLSERTHRGAVDDLRRCGQPVGFALVILGTNADAIVRADIQYGLVAIDDIQLKTFTLVAT